MPFKNIENEVAYLIGASISDDSYSYSEVIKILDLVLVVLI